MFALWPRASRPTLVSYIMRTVRTGPIPHALTLNPITSLYRKVSGYPRMLALLYTILESCPANTLVAVHTVNNNNNNSTVEREGEDQDEG